MCCVSVMPKPDGANSMADLADSVSVILSVREFTKPDSSKSRIFAFASASLVRVIGLNPVIFVVLSPLVKL